MQHVANTHAYKIQSSEVLKPRNDNSVIFNFISAPLKVGFCKVYV